MSQSKDVSESVLGSSAKGDNAFLIVKLSQKGLPLGRYTQTYVINLDCPMSNLPLADYNGFSRYLWQDCPRQWSLEAKVRKEKSVIGRLCTKERSFLNVLLL